MNSRRFLLTETVQLDATTAPPPVTSGRRLIARAELLLDPHGGR